MTEIIVVRHGETDWNASEIFRGRRDICLNETGEIQAKLLGTHLMGTNLEAIYSSPLSRALETARAVADRQGLKVKIAPGLIDFDYGEWEGLAREAVKKKYKALYERWLKKPHLVSIPGGEDLARVRERARCELESIVSSHTGQVLLVSHRVAVKVLICYLLGLDNSHFWLIKHDLGGISIFKHESGRYILVRHNDTSYLGKVEKGTQNDF
jgi:broad specificity phosphatase PhoE